MRQIGTLASEASAQALEDYLLTLDITCRVLPGGDGWEIWVHDESHLEKAKEELDAFQLDPEHTRYRDASRAAKDLRAQAQREESQHQKKQIDIRKRWDRTTGRFEPLSSALIAISVLVALATTRWTISTMLTQMGEKPEPVGILLSVNSYRIQGDHIAYFQYLPDIQRGQVWRLVTPIFIHFGWFHLLFNMFWLYDLGRMIEARQGTVRLLLLVLAAAVLSNLGQYTMSGPRFGGMSGVVYALLGYAWMKSRYEPAAGLYVHPKTVLIMVGWFFLCMTGEMGRIANTAHGVGLGVGMAMGAGHYLWRKLIAR